jgi:outer membrane lipoprotein
MMTLPRTPLLLLVALALGACAGGPKFVTDDVDTSLTPQQALKEQALQQGKRVLWGGMIINSTNLKEQTRIEVLAYPLDSDHSPQTGKAPYGRFLLFRDGYLETVDYAPGRLISVVGRFDGSRRGKVDQSEYIYPVVQAEQLHLWSKGGKGNPRFHFGIGVVFSN